MVRKRMLQAVPEADVVVTNPNHVAVALQYESASMDAPSVVAKGADHLCEKIKEIARAHRVPIVYRPELAWALYEAVDVGQVIPETLFVAVAEVLAMIYRLRQKRLPVGRTAGT
jgi:flagellar biosynthesis protein FlhB